MNLSEKNGICLLVFGGKCPNLWVNLLIFCLVIKGIILRIDLNNK